MALKPRKLTKGDAIGVVSPSSPVTQEGMGKFKAGLEYLEALGFQMIIGDHVFSTSWGYTASPYEKAEDINRMFSEPSIKAIICSQGGMTANACIPYLDWNSIRENPKIFLGMSDISVLLNTIHFKTGLIAFHGNDLMWGWGSDPTPYDAREFVAQLIDTRMGEIPANGERRTIRSGVATGMLMGGNLPCLMKLAGTPYFPDLSGSILFMEALGVTPERCDHLFQQLLQMGVFGQISGAIVGHIDGLENDKQTIMPMEGVLQRVAAKYNFPILKVNDFGHNCPNTVLPVGGAVRLDADQQTIEIVEECVL